MTRRRGVLLSLALAVLLTASLGVTLPGCTFGSQGGGSGSGSGGGSGPGPDPPQFASVLLSVRDPSDPACATDARVAWVVRRSLGAATLVRWALPAESHTAEIEGEPVCVYTTQLTIPLAHGQDVNPSITWAFDESSWGTTCDEPLEATEPGLNNVRSFVRGEQGCQPLEGIPPG